MWGPEAHLDYIHQLQATERRRAQFDREARAVRARRRRWWQKNNH
ncbi:hypothetical protein [Actinocrispum wychmicini]|nr:hypothetical protein [Actinocrispum wychmicini]